MSERKRRVIKNKNLKDLESKIKENCEEFFKKNKYSFL